MKLIFSISCIGLLNLSCSTDKNLSKPSIPSNVVLQVSKTDVDILRRASEILSEEENWNRKDNRQCSKNAETFSLYCSLYKASIEINGEFDHRLAAIEEVRRTVEESSKQKVYEHRLMDYNNDASTSFQDIKDVLRATETRLSSRLKK